MIAELVTIGSPRRRRRTPMMAVASVAASSGPTPVAGPTLQVKMLLKDLSQGARRATSEPPYAVAELAEVASPDRLAGPGEELEVSSVVGIGGEGGTVALVLGIVDFVSSHLTAAELLEESDVLVRIDQLGTGDVVDLPRWQGRGQGGCRCCGAVGPGNEGVGAVSHVRRPPTVVNVFGGYLHAQVGVESVAEDRPADTGCTQVLLAPDVGLRGRKRVGVHRIGDRGPDDVLHPRPRGRFERGAMCCGGVRRTDGADDQRPPSPGEGRRQAAGLLEVAVADAGSEPGDISSESGDRVTKISSEAAIRSSNAATTRRPSAPDAPVTTRPTSTSSTNSSQENRDWSGYHCWTTRSMVRSTSYGTGPHLRRTPPDQLVMEPWHPSRVVTTPAVGHTRLVPPCPVHDPLTRSFEVARALDRPPPSSRPVMGHHLDWRPATRWPGGGATIPPP